MIRYDLALGVIPVAFGTSVVVSNAVGLNTVRALAPAAIVGLLVIAYVCYLHPPTENGP